MDGDSEGRLGSGTRTGDSDTGTLTGRSDRGLGHGTRTWDSNSHGNSDRELGDSDSDRDSDRRLGLETQTRTGGSDRGLGPGARTGMGVVGGGAPSPLDSDSPSAPPSVPRGACRPAAPSPEPACRGRARRDASAAPPAAAGPGARTVRVRPGRPSESGRADRPSQAGRATRWGRGAARERPSASPDLRIDTRDGGGGGGVKGIGKSAQPNLYSSRDPGLCGGVLRMPDWVPGRMARAHTHAPWAPRADGE
jgi:hypothetical protein